VLIAVELAPGAGPYALLTTAPMLALGRLSYSLYLWHFPVFLIFSERASSWPAPVRVLAAWTVALAAAVASYRLVERPALRIKARLGRRPAPPTTGPPAERRVAPAQT
jgi:peptidoglycan/LPS O-acetylase OafA/YrhL